MTAPYTVDDLVAPHTPEIRAITERLRALVLKVAPEAVEEPKRGWKTLVYRAGRVVAFIAPAKGHVNLGFYRGRELPDPHGLLGGSGKDLRHLKVRSDDDIDGAAFTALVRAAFDLERRSATPPPGEPATSGR